MAPFRKLGRCIPYGVISKTVPLPLVPSEDVVPYRFPAKAGVSTRAAEYVVA